MNNLTFEESEKLGKLWSLAREMYEILEDLRPAGGFKEYLDKSICKECGKKKEDRAKRKEP